jgi:UDP-hydrolysing UDP-N-acetyl-D-glucosamine 2-epimerase
MRHVCFVVFSRANYARIKSAILACNEHPNLKISVIVGASGLLYRFGNVSEIIRSDGIRIESEIYNAVEGDLPVAMARTTGLGLIDLAHEFHRLKPDIVVTVADRFETLSTAIAASYMNIFLVHTQGGELTGSIDESVRHAITKLAHLHFPATGKAVDVIRQLGENPKRIFNVGCPSIDIARQTPFENAFRTLSRYSGVGANIEQGKPFLLVTQHPVTTEFQDAAEQISQTLEAVNNSELQAVWLWPNIDSGSDLVARKLRQFRESGSNRNIRFYKNFSAEDYINVLRGCALIVGNSSSGIREANYLGVPSVNIGTRQSQREQGKNVVNTNYNASEILGAIRDQIKKGKQEPEYIYGDGFAGSKMADILATVDLEIVKNFYLNI